MFIIKESLSENRKVRKRERKLIFMTRDKAADKRLSEDITTLSRENESKRFIGTFFCVDGESYRAEVAAKRKDV
jgi:hypothetical protein